jgi:hypothetical protein
VVERLSEVALLGSGVVEVVERVEADHHRPAREKGIADVGPDEPGRAGYQD